MSGAGEDDGEGESSDAAEESEVADMDAADISDDVDEEPAAVAKQSTKGRKRSAAVAGISGRNAGVVPLSHETFPGKGMSSTTVKLVELRD